MPITHKAKYTLCALAAGGNLRYQRLALLQAVGHLRLITLISLLRPAATRALRQREEPAKCEIFIQAFNQGRFDTLLIAGGSGNVVPCWR